MGPGAPDGTSQKAAYSMTAGAVTPRQRGSLRPSGSSKSLGGGMMGTRSPSPGKGTGKGRGGGEWCEPPYQACYRGGRGGGGGGAGGGGSSYVTSS